MKAIENISYAIISTIYKVEKAIYHWSGCNIELPLYRKIYDKKRARYANYLSMKYGW